MTTLLLYAYVLELSIKANYILWTHLLTEKQANLLLNKLRLIK